MKGESSIRTVVDGRELTVSNLDKVFYPASGFTKGEMLDYYAKVAPVMMDHVRDRPLTMKRFPDGVEGQAFFEKHIPVHAPAWVHRVPVPSSSPKGFVEYGVLCDRADLLWAANLGTVEFHVPLWHVGRRRKLPGPPDHMVFDLDPGEGTSIVECCLVGRLIADLLEESGLTCSAKTSGSKGLQLYVPLGERPTWDGVRERARGIAVRLEQDHADLVVSNMRRKLREGKVLIDWSQNHPAKTTVAVYSLRARTDPTVSTPVTWEEVDDCARRADPDVLRFTADQVVGRIERLGDLFADL
jgi:bifunctional non-homologous end joining protein LigD